MAVTEEEGTGGREFPNLEGGTRSEAALYVDPELGGSEGREWPMSSGTSWIEGRLVVVLVLAKDVPTMGLGW